MKKLYKILEIFENFGKILNKLWRNLWIFSYFLFFFNKIPKCVYKTRQNLGGAECIEISFSKIWGRPPPPCPPGSGPHAENLLQSTMLFFIMVCFQISFLIFTGGSNSQNEQSLQLAREFESRRSKMEIRFLDSRPSSDGKWESWAQTTDSNPYPMKYTLRPLTELFTERNFVGTIAWKYTNIYD